MANRRTKDISISPYNPQVAAETSLPGVPYPQGEQFSALAGVAKGLADQVGAFGDRLAQSEGRQAGLVAGLDPNYRPTQDPTLRGQAYDEAATSTYVNTLQAQTRTAINAAYDDYSALPVDQRQPGVLQEKLKALQGDFEKSHVFPSIMGNFRKQFADTSFTYLRAAQNDLDQNVKDRAKAALVGNETSAADAAMRAAALATPEGDALAQKELEAYARIVEAGVSQDASTAEAAAKRRITVQQEVSRIAILAKFDKLPPAEKRVFLQNFQMSYPQGGGLANPQAGDASAPLAQRNNNFTNIRDGGFAKGLPGYQGADGGFAKFASPEDGLRAANANLDSYAAKGVNTVAKIVSRWSPPNENDTPALIANMAKRTGFDPNQPLDMASPEVRASLLRGLIQQETGTAPFEAGQIKDALGGNMTRGLSGHLYTNLIGHMASEIRRQDAAGQALSHAAVQEIGAAQKQIVSGFAAPQAQWTALEAKYAGSADPAVQNALETASEIRTMFADFGSRTPQEIEAQIANAEAQIAQTGASPRQAAVIVAAKDYLKSYHSDLAADPLERAAREGFVPAIAPLDFSKPTLLPGQWANRVQQADDVATRFGRTPAYLRPGEKEAVKRIMDQGGDTALNLVVSAVAGGGPRASAILGEIGEGAPELAHAGVVAQGTGDLSFTRQVADAMAARKASGGGKPSTGDLNEPMRTILGPALNGLDPGERQRTALAAAAWAEHEMVRRNVDPKGAEAGPILNEAIQRARGMTMGPDGKSYGGVGDVSYQGTNNWIFKESMKVEVPSNVRTDRFVDVLDAITDADLAGLPNPPVTPDGKPISASALRRAAPMRQRGGYAWGYMDATNGRWSPVLGQNGAPFVLPWNDLEPVLRRRVWQAFK